MPYYRHVGDVPPKRHTQHRDADGTLYHEELMGAEGFSSDSALLYHRHLPSAITDAQSWAPPCADTVPNHPLRPWHLRLPALFTGVDPAGVDAVTGRRILLANADVRIGYVVAGAPSPLYRDAVGDELAYVQAGSGTLETVFGTLDVHAGDYVVIPRSTTHRWLPSGSLRLYLVETSSHVLPPARYLSRRGQLLEHAPYCERDLRTPGAPLLAASGAAATPDDDPAAGPAAGPAEDPVGRPAEGPADGPADGPVDVLVRHRDSRGGVTGTRYRYPRHPFDVVGWDGCLYPYALDIADFEPITGRVHQPPPSHQVFEGRGFVVCNFVPRKVDYHPLAVPVPYYHSNVDSDEVMFYCGGDYAARRGSGIAEGSVTLHPGGHTHGPQPGAVERSLGVEAVDELAVMVDTFAPLGLTAAATGCADDAYPWSWAGGRS